MKPVTMTGRFHLPRWMAPVTAVAVVALAACSQDPPAAATRPKLAVVLPSTSAASATTGAPAATTTVPTAESRIRTIDDVRAVLTADGTLDVDQAACIIGGMKAVMSEADVIGVFASGDLTRATPERRAAVVKAIGACVPLTVLLRPVAASVQQVARAKGTAVSDTEVDCITKQLAASVTYEDLLLVPAGGTGGLPDAVATSAVKACISPASFAALGLQG